MRFCVENMSFGRPNVASSVVDVSGLSITFTFTFEFERGVVVIKEDDNAGDSATAYSRCSITTMQAENQVVESKAEGQSRAKQRRSEQSREARYGPPPGLLGSVALADGIRFRDHSCPNK